MKGLYGFGSGLHPNIVKERYHAAVVLEVVLVIAVLIAIAILFNSEVRAFAVELFNSVFGSSPALDITG